jgi:ubiquinone/menaquinone biosynthesis C-methylase UbiE
VAKSKNTKIIRDAWEQYQSDYLRFNIQERPDFYEFFGSGGVELSTDEVELVGAVSGLDLLDTCCAADARQSLSWSNLGASVTGCDITSSAIEHASATAARIGRDIRFVVADAHTLEPIGDSSQDIVYATYIVWLEDLPQATRTWHRVLRPGGRLLLRQSHPLVACLDEQGDGSLRVSESYFDRGPDHHKFGGTPIANRHGGWGRQVEVVEFFHRVEDMINAVVDAGFDIERAVEPRDEGISSLPSHFMILARKAQD